MDAHHGDFPGLAAWGAFSGETGAGGCPPSCELAYFSSWEKLWRWHSGGQMVTAETVALYKGWVTRGGSV